MTTRNASPAFESKTPSWVQALFDRAEAAEKRAEELEAENQKLRLSLKSARDLSVLLKNKLAAMVEEFR